MLHVEHSDAFTLAKLALKTVTKAVACCVLILVGTGCSRIASATTEQRFVGITFEKCGSVRQTCVVDGDTFWLQGDKIRVADIDTPEIGEPKCESEYALGMRATRRFTELLNAGTFELHNVGSRDTDRYGRKLRVVTRNGRSLGDQLVAEGLARTWTGRREPWC